MDFLEKSPIIFSSFQDKNTSLTDCSDHGREIPEKWNELFWKNPLIFSGGICHGSPWLVTG
jgi:hypothetical protein